MGLLASSAKARRMILLINKWAKPIPIDRKETRNPDPETHNS